MFFRDSKTEAKAAAPVRATLRGNPAPGLRRWFAQRLYLRLWAAMVLALTLLALVFAWLLQAAADNVPPREVRVRDAKGQLLGQGLVRPGRSPGQGLEFEVRMNDGSPIFVQIPPRPAFRGDGAEARRLPRGPAALIWILAMAALVVAAASYPVIRRLTNGLERLRLGVERWGEGELSARIPVQGEDEVAFLAERFNAAAQRIEGLVQSHTALLESNRSLLANASHELRSPLARIRMALELQDFRPDNASRKELTQNIDELDQLVGEILLASRLDARESELGLVEAVELLGLAAEECALIGAELIVDGSGAASIAPELEVMGVDRLLRRLLRNLLENAKRYGRDRVTLELGRVRQQAVIGVRDDGPGVPAELRERIFEPFFRLPGSRESEASVGLGLALVRSIAERHGGTVRCVEPGTAGGACFVVELPLR